MQAAIPLTQDVVLIGGGHAHALVLRMWGMTPVPGVRLTLIDPRPVTPYTGMLPGHVAGHYDRDAISIDLVRLARFAGARIILGAASALDPVARRITVAGREIAYDVASLDIGITGDLPSVAGFAESGTPVKPFVRFANSWESYLAGPARGPVAVIGAGLGGVELALAMRHRLGAAVPVALIGTAFAPGAAPALAQSLRAELTRAGVTLVEGRVAALTGTEAVLEDGCRIPATLAVGAGGATPQPWLAATGLPLTGGFVTVGPTLEVAGHEGLFAAGDCAHLAHAPRPKAGVFAVRAAPVLFHNLRARATGGTLRPFQPQRTFLRLVSLGDRRAVAEKAGALPWAPSGRLIWRWKDHIDRKFMRRLTDLPAMPRPDAPRTAALGVAEIAAGAPLCAGCGSKVGPGVLGTVLADLPQPARADVLAGPGDDAGILQIGGQRQVLTTDHLRAFVEDPGLMARIAAQHALGDIRAMGAEAQAALVQVILPRASEALQGRMMAEIMQAAAEVMSAEGAVILGGHSTMGAELTIGFTVTGLCERPITLAGARAGDALILTGAIGSGVLLAAEMQGRARGPDIARLWAAMAGGQGRAAPILRGARAMTDVTGFGLAGHLLAICRASGLGARILSPALPVYDGALELAGAGIRSTLYPANRDHAPVFGAAGPVMDLLHDPQTAGGLLACIASGEAEEVLARLHAAGVQAAIIGQMTEGPEGLVLVEE